MALSSRLYICTNILSKSKQQVGVHPTPGYQPFESNRTSIYHFNLVRLSCPITSLPTPSMGHSRASSVKSSLIDPDGGALVNLVVSEGERKTKREEIGLLPQVRLTPIDIEWVHVLSEGWASPLKGFMREDEYLQSLHFNCLRMEDGSVVNMSLPIVLAIDDEQKEMIGTSTDVGLVGPQGDPVGILRRLVLFFCFSMLKWCLFIILLSDNCY